MNRLPRYIVVDFDVRFRLVQTVKRTSFEDRWKIASPSDPFSAGGLKVTPAEFACSKAIFFHSDKFFLRIGDVDSFGETRQQGEY